MNFEIIYYWTPLKEMKAINTNITSMHNDINNLVVVDEDSDMPENKGDVNDDAADGEAEGKVQKLPLYSQ